MCTGYHRRWPTQRQQRAAHQKRGAGLPQGGVTAAQRRPDQRGRGAGAAGVKLAGSWLRGKQGGMRHAAQRRPARRGALTTSFAGRDMDSWRLELGC
eukprot:237852-Chlamydomonas_euryale.AAC.7